MLLFDRHKVVAYNLSHKKFNYEKFHFISMFCSMHSTVQF